MNLQKSLIILEFPDEAQIFVDSFKNQIDLNNSTIIALSISARQILKKHGIAWINTLPYFAQDAHVKSLLQSEKWLHEIESCLKNAPLICNEVCFCIRPYLNYLLWLSEIIDNSIKKHNPEILIGPEVNIPSENLNWKLTIKERPLGLLMKEFGKKYYLEIKTIKVKRMAGKTSLKKGENGFPEKKAPKILRMVLRGIIKQWKKRNNNLLISTTSYGMDLAIKQFPDSIKLSPLCLNVDPRSADSILMIKLIIKYFLGLFKPFNKDNIVAIPLYAFFIENQSVKVRNSSTEDWLDSAEKHINISQQKFSNKGINFCPFITTKLMGGIKFHLKVLNENYYRLKALIKTINPAIVISPYSVGIYSLLGEISGELDVPTLMITHGSHIPPKNGLEEIEQWRLGLNLILTPFYKYTVAQSPLAVKLIEYFKKNKEIIKTLPVTYARSSKAGRDRIRMQLAIPDDVSVILFAVAQRKRSSIRFLVYQTEDEYMKDLRDLIFTVNQLKKTVLIFKLHPSSELTEEEIKLESPPCEKLHILHQEPFSEILSASDVLVSYGSTVIEEAIFNRIPVVLYDQRKHYCHIKSFDCNTKESGEWPVAAAYYTSSKEILLKVIRHALQHKDINKNNKEIYQSHCFSEQDVDPLSYHISNIV